MSDCFFTSVYENAIFASFALATDNKKRINIMQTAHNWQKWKKKSISDMVPAIKFIGMKQLV